MFGQTCIGRSVARVFLDRFLKVLLGLHPICRCLGLGGVRAAQQLDLVGFRVDGSGVGEADLPLRRQPDPNLAGHASGHLPLYGEDVPWVELVSLCPKMALGYRLNEVGSDADSMSRAERGAFQKRINLELARDLR